jgi:oligopeptide/dipeptide ABC transporter ATP-binding protein
VTALSVLGLIEQPPGKVESNGILWKGHDLTELPDEALRSVRGGEIAMIFQDPMTSLNPVYTVGQQIAEMRRIHFGTSKADALAGAVELLDLVGIPRPEQRVHDYPHQLSGGMRQRVMIAMAVACDPDLLIADEPTTALDVTIQAQVLDVLERIQERTNTAVILITHDLGIVAGLADRVMVMYAGRVAELGRVDDIFYRSMHPYTLGLLASLPRLDEDMEGVKLYRIKGQPPSLIRVPPGCAYHPRCEFAVVPDPCSTTTPGLRALKVFDHVAACHYSAAVQPVQPADLRPTKLSAAKAAPKNARAKKRPAKKAVAKKVTAKKATVKKATVKKASVTKATVKKHAPVKKR